MVSKPKKKQKIVLIEDNVYQGEVNRKILGKSFMAHDIVSFPNGESFINYLSWNEEKGTRPCIYMVIVDYRLRGLNGIETAIEAQKLYQSNSWGLPRFAFMTSASDTIRVALETFNHPFLQNSRVFFNPMTLHLVEEMYRFIHENKEG